MKRLLRKNATVQASPITIGPTISIMTSGPTLFSPTYTTSGALIQIYPFRLVTGRCHAHSFIVDLCHGLWKWYHIEVVWSSDNDFIGSTWVSHLLVAIRRFKILLVGHSRSQGRILVDRGWRDPFPSQMVRIFHHLGPYYSFGSHSHSIASTNAHAPNNFLGCFRVFLRQRCGLTLPSASRLWSKIENERRRRFER